LEDLVLGKWSDNKLEEVIRETAENDGYGVPIIIEQEPGSSGKQYAAHLKNNILGDFRVTVRAPQSDKWLKAQPFIGAASRGKVKMLRASWNKALTDQFKDFPSVEHDDIVDSVSQGYNELNSAKNQSVTWGRPKGSSSNSTNSESAPLRGATFGRN
jgi:predicted phage terminase large subunit-like protein